MKPVKIGLLGLGTVGGGTVKVLKQNASEISRRAGRDIIISAAAALNLSLADDLDLQDVELTTDAYEVVRNPEIDVIVELIGGYSPACELVLEAIANGKHVVTANKALIALHGNEIFAKAQEKGVTVAFEAAVAGGIPVIKSIREGLAGNSIELVAGIINGTGNFILTEMRDKGRDFDDVLKEAQELGYAESDPTFDVEGIDAAHKLTILASIAFGIPLQFDKAYTEGITEISSRDVNYCEELGYFIKHLGITKRLEDGIELRVHPTLIPKSRLIANVNGVMNAVLVVGDAVGPTLYYGAGAGAMPTASAVVADIVDTVRTLTTDPGNRVPHLAFQANELSDLPIVDISAIETAYYLRMRVKDETGVLADITRILADNDISIEAFLQKEAKEDTVDIVLLTDIVKEYAMNNALDTLGKLDSMTDKITRIRCELLG